MQPEQSHTEFHFSSALPIIIFCRPADQPTEEWIEFDRGPGYFNLPEGQEVMIKVKQINDDDLCQLTYDLAGCSMITSLDLAENRKVTDGGLECLKSLSQLIYLNLSSCDITNKGLLYLLELQHLRILNLSYCHRLTDLGLRPLKGLPHLVFLDLQGVLKITKAGMSKIYKAGLTIRR
jgi:hypothetical protein